MGDDEDYEQQRRRYVEQQEYDTGRRQHPPRHHHSSETSYGGGGAWGGITNDFSEAEEHATREAGSSGDRGLFSNALSMLNGQHQSLGNSAIDEGFAMASHNSFFGSGSSPEAGSVTSSGVGHAAAMEAMKMFTGGGGSSSGGMFGSSGGSSGGGQNAFIGMAMAQASKLYDQQSSMGNTHPSSSKEDSINEAAQMAMKMYMKSEMGGGSSSSSSGLMGMASKFFG